MADTTEPEKWIVPLTPDSLPRDLLADIGEMALSFAFAEISIAEAISIGKRADMGTWTKNSISNNLGVLSSLRPSLSKAIEQMKEDANCRNTIMHGALQAVVGITDGPLKAQAHNYSYGGRTQQIDPLEVKRLAHAAFAFAIAVISSN